jgi:hypothetical protein
MNENDKADGNGELVGGVITAQLAHFRSADPPCRGVQLPDGVLLRHTQSASLYFYLKTTVENGAIRTQVFASDSPYDRQKASIGLVITPMFDPSADLKHLEKVEGLVRDWVDFVKQDVNSTRDFRSFSFGERG